MNKIKLSTFVTLLLIFVSTNTFSDDDSDRSKPKRSKNVNVVNTPNVNVVNTPNVTVTNPQSSVTVDNGAGNPVPVVVQGGTSGPSEPQFVRFSVEARSGDAGYPLMNNTCRDSYGAGTKMCHPSEVADSVVLPITSDATHAWVDKRHPLNTNSDDYVTFGSASDNCFAWKSNNSIRSAYVVSRDTGEILALNTSATTVSGQPRVFALGSCADSRPVACCK